MLVVVLQINDFATATFCDANVSLANATDANTSIWTMLP